MADKAEWIKFDKQFKVLRQNMEFFSSEEEEVVNLPKVYQPAPYVRITAQETTTETAEITFDNNKYLNFICKQ